MNRATVQLKLSQSQDLIDLIDLLREPFLPGEISTLKGEGCDDLTNGKNIMFTPADEVAIVKLRLGKYAHYAVGDPETLRIYERGSKLDEVIADLVVNYDLHNDI